MIRPVKTGAPGFTLLEMIIALFILMLLLGMAVTVTRTVFADEDLRQANRKLQIFAKTAHKQASRENRPWEIVLYPDSIVLRPGPEREGSTEERETDPIQYSFSGNVQLKVKLWGSKEWASPREMVWTFAPSGLNAPHRFHLSRNESWMEMSFNPLTANPQDEEFYLP